MARSSSLLHSISLFSSRTVARRKRRLSSLPAVTDVMSFLRDPTLLKSSSYINGKFSTSDKGQASTRASLSIINPSTQQPIHTLEEASESQIKKGYEGARVAFESANQLKLTTRLKLLDDLHKLIKQNTQDLATLVTLENGKPFSQAIAEVKYASSFFPWCTQPALHRYETYVDTDSPSTFNYTTRVPAGVVLAITPWNFPLALICRKIVPAIAAGCAVVCKPSELTPLSSLALTELLSRLDFPDGLFNCIISSDGKGVLQAGLDHNAIDMISFTGSSRVGHLVGCNAVAHGCSNLSLELGGNAPFIVFDDADLKTSLDMAISNKVRCSGQACVSANRFLVQGRIYDEFINALCERVTHLRTGDGMNEKTDLGPVINVQAKLRISQLVSEASSQGARILTGAENFKSGGESSLHMSGTVIADVTDDMKLATEEIFGPVWSVLRFSSTEEVIRRANSSHSGLAAYVFSKDLKRTQAVSHSLRYGMVGVNSGSVSDAVTPFGGMKDSGCGREGGLQAVAAYSQVKYVKQNM